VSVPAEIPTPSQRGSPRDAIGSTRDDSVTVPGQRELIQAQKMDAIGRLAADVWHEINNPLAAILGFSDLIRRDPRLPQDMKSDADLLVEEATRTRRIVQNLLDFARQRAPERHPTSMRALIDSVLALQWDSFGPGRIEVIVDVPDGFPLVELDRSRMQQVLVNLTQNAIHAIRESGRAGHLSISARRVDGEEGPRVRVAVADDGAGVAAEHVPRLFVPFFTTRAPAEGTGLGLSVSFDIVASHGGELRYAPGPEGRGAVFSFDLPLRPASPDDTSGERRDEHAPDGAVSPTASGVPGQTARILVLDDERPIRLLLEKWLRTAGYDPVVATTGEEAVELVRGGSFDAILCDHRMAGMNGTEVFEAVVDLRPELNRRFVFMSGDVLNPQLRAFAQERGVTLLAKPFDLDAVRRTVEAVLGGGSPTPD